MTRTYFGTDGIRGRANTYPMTADIALKVALATARVLKRSGGGRALNRVVIGKDTRLSCYFLEHALSAGFLSMGMDVVLTGPLPTPAVAVLTRSLRADVGVVISASHNPYQDNGIKLFGPDGYKLADSFELEIERWMDHPDLSGGLPPPDRVGRASRLDDSLGRYIEYVKASFPRGQTLEGVKVVVDCANGAAYRAAPAALWELEADVVPIGVSPNGRNINEGCGATATALLQQTVLEEQADLGIALDGDADRLILVDECGKRIDGDQILALLAASLHAKGMLRGDAVVATVMSNLGLERYLGSLGVRLVRTSVGDRYVVEKMREGGYALGGEQSGHVILSDYGTTGDGLLTALHVLSVLRDSGKKASDVLGAFSPVPQVLRNVHFSKGFRPLEDEKVREAVTQAESSLSSGGRVLVRASGTEPVIRVMAEGDDAGQVENVVNSICLAIERSAAEH